MSDTPTQAEVESMIADCEQRARLGYGIGASATYREAARLLRALLDASRADAVPAAPVVANPPIVGWMVGNDPQTAAVYNASEGAAAMDAAKRWICCLTALVTHPAAPILDAAAPVPLVPREPTPHIVMREVYYGSNELEAKAAFDAYLQESAAPAIAPLAEPPSIACWLKTPGSDDKYCRLPIGHLGPCRSADPIAAIAPPAEPTPDEHSWTPFDPFQPKNPDAAEPIAAIAPDALTDACDVCGTLTATHADGCRRAVPDIVTRLESADVEDTDIAEAAEEITRLRTELAAMRAATGDALQRWGNADTDEVGRKSGWHQRADGYWTPWHLAAAQNAEQGRRLEAAERDARDSLLSQFVNASKGMVTALDGLVGQPLKAPTGRDIADARDVLLAALAARKPNAAQDAIAGDAGG